MKPIEIKAVLGLRNDVSPERFEFGDLAVATNVEFDETGKSRRRLGFTEKASGDWHSLFGCGDYGYGVKDGVLQYLDSAGQASPITSVAGRVTYAREQDKIFWSDEFTTGQLTGASNQSWGIRSPDVSFTTVTGNLREGRYLITATYVAFDGKESGALGYQAVHCTGAEGLLIAVGATTDPSVAYARVYVSACNGELPYAVGEVLPGNALTLTELPTQMLALRTSLLSPAPAGKVLGVFAGRAYVATNKHLWYSQPYEYGLFNLASSYLTVSDTVRLFAPVTDGIFLGTDSEIIFLRGTEPEKFGYEPLADYGAVEGTLSYVPAPFVLEGTLKGLVPMWFSKRGACAGMNGGELVNLTAERLVSQSVRRGASLLKIRGGTPCFISSLFTS